VLLGSCFEDLGVPYGPFVQALKADVAGLADAEVRRRVGTHARAIARLVTELVPVLGSNDASVAAGVAHRAEVYAALRDYLCRAAEGAPLLLVLEDLHWSTPTTRRAVRHLAQAGGPAPTLVVVTARDTPPELDEALAAFLGDLARYPNVATVSLSGLVESEIRDLLSGVGTDIDPFTVCAATGGNPLFALELATAGHRGPTSLASVLAARCRRLAPRDLEVLDLAAVLGSEFDARLLAAADATDLTEVLEALERAEAAGVVTASPGQPGRFSFVHALFRSIRYDGLPGSRRLALHRRAVEALRPRADDERVLPELARHACIAAPLGEARAALDYARRAGEMAERLLAMDEAALHYRAALEMDDLIDPPDPQRRLRLRIALGAALLYAGDPEGRRILLASARDARTQANRDAVTAVALVFAWHVMGATTSVERADADVVSVFEDALNTARSEPSAPRARLLAGLSAELVFTDLDRSHRLINDAVAMARSLDDPRTLGQTLLTHRYVYREPGRSDEGTSIYEELIALGKRLDEPVFTTAGLAEQLYAHREVGDLERAAEIELELAAALGDRPLVVARLYLTTCRASGRFLAGDLPGAQRLAKDAVSLALEPAFSPPCGTARGSPSVTSRAASPRCSRTSGMSPSPRSATRRRSPRCWRRVSPAPDGGTTPPRCWHRSRQGASTSSAPKPGSQQRSILSMPSSCSAIAPPQPSCATG
jgi:predicted ATPase